MNSVIPNLHGIELAAREMSGTVTRTACLAAPKLSSMTGASVFVKYENMHVTTAFKERGAFIKLNNLTLEERQSGVIAMSAGNHAQAVAYHASRMNIPSLIVMPVSTPFVKVAATENFGAKVILQGETVQESGEIALEIARQDHLTFVHPFDDFHVIRGQGTIGLEMLQDVPELDVILVPIGGGGLISGVGIAAKAMKPDIEIVGVEAVSYPSMYNALNDKQLDCGGQTLAEGIAVKKAGILTAAITKNIISDIVLVSETDLEQAVNAFLTIQKTMAEGAGAAGLAALMANRDRFLGKNVGLILCGGNIDPRILSSIMVRELAREEKIVQLHIEVPDRPGVLGEIASIIGSERANILEVHHQRMSLKVSAKGAFVDISIETRDGEHARHVMRKLHENGFANNRA
ncbi:MAG: threonine ammonia-lyase [Cohaesibacteraceae bacterium]|nr:threonine ammonia-lyase [Cohaesibacteraceae bacterium]